MRITFAIVLLWSSFSSAGTFSGPTSTALGGAGAAGVHILEASHTNPATLPHVRGYYLGFLYNSLSSRQEGGSLASSFADMGILLTDASEEVLVPATISYIKGSGIEADAEFDETEIHVGLGFKVVKMLSMGLSVERFTRAQRNGAEFLDHNVSLGTLLTPRKNLGFALVFHDMLNTRNIQMNPTTTLGAFWMYETFLKVYFDWSQPQKNNPSRREIIATGIESIPIGHGIAIRTGGRWDQFIGKRYMTTGLGWDGPNLSANYGYEKNLDFDEYRHLVDMRVQF